MEDIRSYRDEEEKKSYHDEDDREREREWSASSDGEEVPFDIPRD